MLSLRFSLALILASSFLTLAQAGDFSVNVVGKMTSKEAIQVDNAWRTDLSSRFRVSLRSSKEIPGSALVFTAYFYDADGNLLKKQSGPNAIWTGTKKGTESVGLPEQMKAGQMETVYLATPAAVDKMKTLLVVFGSGDQLTYDIYPGSKKIEDFTFDEKDKVSK
jgi:hypothetical protein